ncbi:hypothetical protein EYF80_005071 [Liparis tanakae]|uniref:Uncharacterized protein n=1 Tax=Liparis tanakae TaxID=230148 RepID=A0A4Z2J386_9TELE|nr:hypothetical protein EYF80_005071 [Liparis tanakae]
MNVIDRMWENYGGLQNFHTKLLAKMPPAFLESSGSLSMVLIRVPQGIRRPTASNKKCPRKHTRQNESVSVDIGRQFEEKHNELVFAVSTSGSDESPPATSSRLQLQPQAASFRCWRHLSQSLVPTAIQRHRNRVMTQQPLQMTEIPESATRCAFINSAASNSNDTGTPRQPVLS